ncbi:hypothetical protein HMPREF9103_02266 [Lentilactobacillus parafarraginis F0439]|uniref:Uncharacterized protein n=1 Tax=Lentilactobacillus parafarraginis F0439 TaxID=797515 RepID=G9ZRA5_9LACO|nr:hypothetical protein HMPREF9103_02266 [Lentilactobacillus parafarraginis F0439]
MASHYIVIFDHQKKRQRKIEGYPKVKVKTLALAVSLKYRALFSMK